jgi:hypothetical protein
MTMLKGLALGVLSPPGHQPKRAIVPDFDRA